MKKIKQNKKILIGVLTVLLVGTLIYFSTDSTQFQGRLKPLTTSPLSAQADSAPILIDSKKMDNDFDGVLFPHDKCPDVPEHLVVRFNVNDAVTFLGQKVIFKEAYNDHSMRFDVNGKSYGVDMNKSITSIPLANNPSQTFTIKALFFKYSPSGQHEAIIVLRSNDYNHSTGCK